MAHKNGHNDLSAIFIKQFFDYEPNTGFLRWKISISRRANIGKIAGWTDDQGRVKVGIQGKEYFAHRIIWVWMTGKWPEYEVDHKNEKKHDNRWANLREATPSENHRNRGAQKNNTAGFKGVCFDKRAKKFTAGIKLHGVRHNLGLFTTAEAAHRAYVSAAKKLHGTDWMKS